jgi:hypothetical protein
MKAEVAIAYVSIAVIAISLFFIGAEITGFATYNSTAVVNVTIQTSAGINFTTAFLDFGSGTVTPGKTAVLDSTATTNTFWTGGETTGELVLKNIGNEDLTLQLKTDKSVGDFIIAGATMEALVADNSGHSGACTGANAFSSYAEITTSLQTACGTAFAYDPTDEIIIDFRLNIPSSALGPKTMTITAVGTGA